MAYLWGFALKGNRHRAVPLRCRRKIMMRKTTKNLLSAGALAVAMAGAPILLLAAPQDQSSPPRSEQQAQSTDRMNRMGQGMGMMHSDMPMMEMMTEMKQMMRTCNKMMEAKLQERQSDKVQSRTR